MVVEHRTQRPVGAAEPGSAGTRSGCRAWQLAVEVVGSPCLVVEQLAVLQVAASAWAVPRSRVRQGCCSHLGPEPEVPAVEEAVASLVVEMWVHVWVELQCSEPVPRPSY